MPNLRLGLGMRISSPMFKIESWITRLTIQLIKDMTQDNARREVEYQLDICGGIITYQDLLKHLSVAFQGGDEEANLIAEFYSRGQKSKEMEEAFADELQILARKVMNRKPDFRQDLDMTLKQRYASQLFDKNSACLSLKCFPNRCQKYPSRNSAMSCPES